MCEVCAVFGRGRHWTARASSIAGAVESLDLKRYRAERRQTIRLLNALLASHSLQAADWDGEAYRISAPSGASVIAQDLAQVWSTLGRLGAADFDPLAEDFLAGRS